MPSPERGGPPQPAEDQPHHETEPVPYYRAARFASERLAGQAYFQLQDLLLGADEPAPDLSVYRLQLNRIYHVVVLGEPPPEDVDRQLADLLAGGDPATLPDEVLRLLAERRAEATRRGPWTEGHYRPGRPL